MPISIDQKRDYDVWPIIPLSVVAVVVVLIVAAVLSMCSPKKKPAPPPAKPVVEQPSAAKADQAESWRSRLSRRLRGS